MTCEGGGSNEKQALVLVPVSAKQIAEPKHDLEIDNATAIPQPHIVPGAQGQNNSKGRRGQTTRDDRVCQSTAG